MGSCVQGQKVGSCAYVTSLRRTQNGAFNVKDAWQIEDLANQAWEKRLPKYKYRYSKQDIPVLPPGTV